MSLFSALTVAVGGLNAQSSAIGNISDNLSNTQTTGFKRIDTTFETLVTQSNSKVNDPGGVRATPKYQNDIQGTLTQTSSSTDLAISGQGFFQVRPSVVDASGTTTFGNDSYYTRRGDFSLDKDGYLVNGAGYFLTANPVSSTGVVGPTAEPVRIAALLDNPVASTTSNYAANLPAGAAVNYASTPSTIQIFDSLGAQHDMTYTWHKTGTNAWTLDVVVQDGKLVAGSPPTHTDFSVSVPFTFDTITNAAGTPPTVAGTLAAINGGASTADYNVIDNSTKPVNAAQIAFDLDFDGAGPQTVTSSFGTYHSSSGTTQFNDTTVAVSTFDQNGIPRGSFKDLSIDKNGFLTLNYDNGRSKTFYQIKVAQFFAQDQLQRANGGAYQQTIDSGNARIGAAGTLGAGTIVGNSLESSNVDIADEFTKLIQAQRVYSANAKTITTADSMLQEVINIVR